MNFQTEKERDAMERFARTGVYDFVEENSNDSESYVDDHTPYCCKKKDNIARKDKSEEELDSCVRESENNDDIDETESEESLSWSSEKRFRITPKPRSNNRFKSFRRS